MDGVELVKERATGPQVGQQARAIGRPGPPMPLDAGVINAEHDITPAAIAIRGKADQQKACVSRAASAAIPSNSESWNNDVIGNALLETELEQVDASLSTYSKNHAPAYEHQ